jgi:hypothetical protein
MAFKREKKSSEVISLRLNDERVEVLERHRQALTEQLHRAVSLSEAAFLIIEDRAEMIDRETQRYELLKNPAEALWSIRRKWETEHSLSAAEWDVLAVYIQIGAEEQRQEPPLLRPAAPSRESYLALLEAFEGIIRLQREESEEHVWYYFSNLDGHAYNIPFPKDDAGRRYEAVLKIIAIHKEQAQAESNRRYPGSIGRCLLTAIQAESMGSRRLDQVLAPYWPVLWRIAARGHWLHHQLPVRIVKPDSSGPADRHKLSPPIETRGLVLSFRNGGNGDIAFQIEFRAPRNFIYSIPRYPALVEFRAMLEELGDLRAWNGRYFHAVVTAHEDSGETRYSLWPKQQDWQIDFTDKEWPRLRDVFRQAWDRPEMVERMAALQLEYGEQG